MASRLTPFGMVVKWFIVPLVLCAIGYFLVGPRVQDKVPAEIQEKVRKVAGSQEPDERKPETPAKTFAAPEVDVTVTALNSRENKPKPKRRRRRSTTPKKETVETPQPTPVVAPPPPISDGDSG